MEIRSSNKRYCEICSEEARNLCFQCNIYYCDSCYKLIHEKKNNLNHIKEIIDPFVPIDTKCPDHPNVPLNLFCVDEKSKIYFI